MRVFKNSIFYNHTRLLCLFIGILAFSCNASAGIVIKDTSGNEVYARALGNVHDEIREGETFANPLRAAKIVDSIVVNMIDVGEETGDLDKMLVKIADNYDEEVEVLVDGLVSILEPVMVVILGGIVGFIVISLFLPLVTLINSVS